MNVLVACEESQAVCLAFRRLGHRAFSCDLQECSGGYPEYHFKGDMFDVIANRKVWRKHSGKVHIVVLKTLLLLCGQKVVMKRTMSKEEFLALYKRQQSSGLTIKDFCDNESYPASCFHYWKKKYGLSHPYTKHTEPTGDSFIPLNINHTPAIPTSSCGDRRVTIELPSGIKIHLNILSNPEIIYGLISKLCSHVLPE